MAQVSCNAHTFIYHWKTKNGETYNDKMIKKTLFKTKHK